MATTDQTGFTVSDDGHLFHHGVYIGTILHEHTIEDARHYCVQGVAVVPEGEGLYREYRSIATAGMAAMPDAQVAAREHVHRASRVRKTKTKQPVIPKVV